VIAVKPVVNLPQDQGKWYVSVVGENTDPRYQQLVRWFQTDRDLQGLRAQTHYNEILTSTATYAERYKPNVKGLPTVRVQDSESRVVYEASGNNLPFTAGGLYSAIAKAIIPHARGERICPWNRPCPTPGPTPEPAPAPDADPIPVPIDDGGAPIVTPPNTLNELVANSFMVLLGGVFGISFLIGVAYNWYRQYNFVKRG
jgi:hypothetical protein